jgi:hypothetical protein
MSNASPRLVSNQRIRPKQEPMKKLMIQLSRNTAEQNWSIQVNDTRHEFVALMFVQQLVTQSVAGAKMALLQAEERMIASFN